MSVDPSAEKKPGPEELISIVLPFERFVTSENEGPSMITAPLLKVIAYCL